MAPPTLCKSAPAPRTITSVPQAKHALNPDPQPKLYVPSLMTAIPLTTLYLPVDIRFGSKAVDAVRPSQCAVASCVCS